MFSPGMIATKPASSVVMGTAVASAAAPLR
jgi:hypothetical protein